MGIIDRLFGREPEQEQETAYERHLAKMTKAAGIGVARVRCHRATWTYLETYVPRYKKSSETLHGDSWEAFSPPGQEEITTEEDGMVTVPLSGTTLAAVLAWCRDIRRSSLSDWDDVDKAIGQRVEAAISDALQRVVPSAGSSGPSTCIYLDDRIAESGPAQ